MNDNINPALLRPGMSNYPELAQLVKVTGAVVVVNIYPGKTQQYNGALGFRDREDCYILEPNNISLTNGHIYDARLIGSYSGLPLYAVACCTGTVLTSSSSAASM